MMLDKNSCENGSIAACTQSLDSRIIGISCNKSKTNLTGCTTFGGSAEDNLHDDSSSHNGGAVVVVRREGRIASLMRVLPSRGPRISMLVSAHIAFEHFNQRSGAVLSYLPNRLKDCDFYFSWEFIDTSGSPLWGAKQLWEENAKVCRGSSQKVVEEGAHEDVTTADHDIVMETCPPFAVLGGMVSRVSHVLSILGNAYDLPIVSGVSTANDLDGKPFFARTVPTDAAKGQAIALYLDSLDVSHVAIIYSDNPWGTNFHVHVMQALQQRKIRVISLPVIMGEPEHAIEQLAASEYKYVVFLYSFPNKLEVCRLAHSYGVMGHPGYTWLSGGGFTEFASGDFSLNRTTERDLAKALHGAAYFEEYIPTHQPLRQALLEFSANRTSQEDFIQHFQKPEIMSGHNFSTPFTNRYNYYVYDAVMAMGMTACETPGLFTGEDFYGNLLTTQFEGVSGYVSFNPETHTRSASGINYAVQNIVISEERSTSDQIYFTGHLTSVINTMNGTVDQIQPYIYADNTTQQPLALPALVQEYNLIPLVARIILLSLCFLVALTSLGWMAWTIKNRKSPLIRASQPFFLCQLCIGTFIMGLSVIPSSLQEPTPKQLLDIACMSVPWFFFLGFVTSFSAIFGKTWRLNKLMQSASNFRRSQILPRDVLWPFFTLITINVVFLVAWTVVYPVQWERVDVSNYDSFGRSQESYGRCDSSGKHILIPLVVANFVPVLISLYQCWKARHISDELSDSFCFSLSVFSICETTVISIPVLLAVDRNPMAKYILRSLFTFAIGLAILLPIFVPKFLKNRTWNRRSFKVSAGPTER